MITTSLDVDGIVESQVGLFGRARPSEKVVEDMEAAFSCWHGSNPTPFQAMVDDLAANQSWIDGRRSIVL